MINDLLGIKYPIFCGAMANITDGKFASVVSNAGGLGIIASGGNDSNWVREQIRICKENTNKPFGVNLMLMSPYCDDIAKVIIEEHVDVVTTGAGSPNKYIKMFNEVGIKTIPVVGCVAQAVRAERAGAFAIIAEGMESGGHIGEETTIVIVSEIVDACNIPVIAAGGIVNGKTFNAALSLGAEGVQAGTIFIATKECPVSEEYKNIIIGSRDIDTVVTGRKFGAPVRIYKNELARNYIELENQAVDRLELEKIGVAAHKKAVLGDMKNGSIMMGQNSGLINEIRTVKDTIDFLITDSIKEKEVLLSKINSLKELN